MVVGITEQAQTLKAIFFFPSLLIPPLSVQISAASEEQQKMSKSQVSELFIPHFVFHCIWGSLKELIQLTEKMEIEIGENKIEDLTKETWNIDIQVVGSFRVKVEHTICNYMIYIVR